MKRFFLIAALTGLAACSDIIEKDLTGLGVVLLTPADGDTTSANVVTFRWEEVPHATSYALQIATPGFDHPVAYAADTTVSGTSIALPLSPGTYIWRVAAQNDNSETGFYARSLVVEAASDLEDLTPLLLAPVANAVTAADPVLFEWDELDGAEDYRFELRSGDQSGPLLQAQIVNGTSMSVSALPEGSYTWGVQAQSASSASLFAYRGLQVDRTAPGQPLLIAPAANAVIQHVGFTFEWQSGSGGGITTDSLFVNDANQVPVRTLEVDATSYADSLGLGTYTWWVRTTDAAGNGTSSAIRTLVVQ